MIVTASGTGGLCTITRMIRRYTSPKGGVIFDHPYNDGYAFTAHLGGTRQNGSRVVIRQ